MKNHYISQLIIKRFSPEVTTFDVQERKLIENRQPHKIFYQENIYDNDIEKQMAHDLEQPFAELLDRKILNNNSEIILTRSELNLVKKFLLLDSVRTYSAEHFRRTMLNFSNCVKHYMAYPMMDEEILKRLPSLSSLNISDYDLQMRAMKLYLDCADLLEISNHSLCNQEFYLWAKVNSDSYLTFWDSADNQEFILSSTGMVSDYEPSHDIFEGLDLSKFSYLLDMIRNKSIDETEMMFYAKCLSFNTIMYENFNIFNLSATRCMVLVHPFFRLYNDIQAAINGKFLSAPKPDIWPTCFETKEITTSPQNRYMIPGFYLPGDLFCYKPIKLSEYDTIYLNQLILRQNNSVIGFRDIQKVIDSFCCMNFFNAINQKDLYEVEGIEALGKLIDGMIEDRFYYIFEYFKDLKLQATFNVLAYIDHYSEMAINDTRWNIHVLKYLLSDEEKLKTMKNFAFMGPPDIRVALLKQDLQKLESGGNV